MGRAPSGADGASKRGGDLRALAARDAACENRRRVRGARALNRGGGASLPRMPPSGYRGARGAVSAEQTKPRGEAEKTKPNAVAENPTLARSTHRSIFLAGGAVANVHRIAVDFDHPHPKSRAGALNGNVNVAYASANGNGVVDQIFESGKHVEVILGARARTAAFGDPLQTDPTQVPLEYLVKWIGHSHIHNSWMAEDPLDQLAPAKFGEYVLQYGRVPRMLADERWSKPQRVVAELRAGGSPAATAEPGNPPARKTSPTATPRRGSRGRGVPRGAGSGDYDGSGGEEGGGGPAAARRRLWRRVAWRRPRRWIRRRRGGGDQKRRAGTGSAAAARGTGAKSVRRLRPPTVPWRT